MNTNSSIKNLLIQYEPASMEGGDMEKGSLKMKHDSDRVNEPVCDPWPKKKWKPEEPIKEVDSLRYVLIGCIVFHLGFAVWHFLTIELLQCIWSVGYAYIALWSYMSMHRCLIYVYLLLLCWLVVSDGLSLLKFQYFLKYVIELAGVVGLIYLLWDKSNEYNRALSEVKNGNYYKIDAKKVANKVMNQDTKESVDQAKNAATNAAIGAAAKDPKLAADVVKQLTK